MPKDGTTEGWAENKFATSVVGGGGGEGVRIGLQAKVLGMPEREFMQAYHCMAVNNSVYMVEMKRMYDTFKAKVVSQARDIAIAAEVAVRARKDLNDAHSKVKEMQLERADVIKGARRAEVARAQAEAEAPALRAGRLEMLGMLSKAEGEAAALKAENAELMKKLVEVEAAKS